MYFSAISFVLLMKDQNYMLPKWIYFYEWIIKYSNVGQSFIRDHSKINTRPKETKFFVWGGGQRAISFLFLKIAMQ
jgi:hypothetical protein